MSNPIDQHYVPKVYLKKFSIEESLFYLRIKPFYTKNFPKKIFTSGICYEPHIYTFQSEYYLQKDEVQTPFEVELNQFNYEDTFLTYSFDCLINTQQLSKDDFFKFLRMLLDIKRRNPVSRNVYRNPKNIDKIKADIDKKVEYYWNNIISEKDKRGQDKDKLLATARKKLTNLYSDANFIDDNYRHGFIKEAGVFLNLTKKLEKCVCKIYKAENKLFFITSDNPGLNISNEQNATNYFKNVERFLFPLDSKHIFVAFWNETAKDFNKETRKLELVRASADFVEKANEMIVSNCNNFIYSEEKKILEEIFTKIKKEKCT